MLKNFLKSLTVFLFVPFLIVSCKSNDFKNEVREFKGKIEIVMEDFKDGTTHYNLFLENEGRYELVPANQNVKLKLSMCEPGEIVKVKGVKEGNKIYIVEIKR